MNLIQEIENNQLKSDLPDIRSGDTVKVNVKVSEGNRERIQTYEGVVISINGVTINKTITVRKLSFGVGVERIFPIHAPIIESIEVTRKGKVEDPNFIIYVIELENRQKLKKIELPKVK